MRLGRLGANNSKKIIADILSFPIPVSIDGPESFNK
jgi:hypothetical protein